MGAQNILRLIVEHGGKTPKDGQKKAVRIQRVLAGTGAHGANLILKVCLQTNGLERISSEIPKLTGDVSRFCHARVTLLSRFCHTFVTKKRYQEKSKSIYIVTKSYAHACVRKRIRTRERRVPAFSDFLCPNLKGAVGGHG